MWGLLLMQMPPFPFVILSPQYRECKALILVLLFRPRFTSCEWLPMFMINTPPDIRRIACNNICHLQLFTSPALQTKVFQSMVASHLFMIKTPWYPWYCWIALDWIDKQLPLFFIKTPWYRFSPGNPK